MLCSTYQPSTLSFQAAPLRHTSVEGLCVGDLLFLHCKDRDKRSHIMIKMGNRLSMLPELLKTTFKGIPVYNDLVHVEMVVSIDEHGRAVLGGVRGITKVARVVLFQEFVESLNDDITHFQHLRPLDQNFANACGVEVIGLVQRGVKYDGMACNWAMVPRPFKDRDTREKDGMMCQEFILNAQFMAEERVRTTFGYESGCVLHRLRAQTSPAKTAYKLGQSDRWVDLGAYPVAPKSGAARMAIVPTLRPY